jgi:hypothetical protein
MNIKLGNRFNAGFQSVMRLLFRIVAASLALGVSVSATAAPVDPASAGDALVRLESHIGAMLADVRASETASQASIPPAENAAEKPSVSIPVPAALWLFGSGLGALGYAGRYAKRRMSKASTHRHRQDIGETTAAPCRPVYIQVALRERMRQTVPVDDCLRVMAKPTERSGASSGGQGRDGAPPKAAAVGCEAMQRFTELSAALTEQPAVALGRSFGMPSLKLGKRPFLVYDENDQGLAFRVGQHNAGLLLDYALGISLWNPKRERQPKQSWVLCQHGSGETLVHLAAAAYEHALGDAPAVEPATAGQASFLEAA